MTSTPTPPRSRNRLGAVSLTVAAVGMVAAEVAQHAVSGHEQLLTVLAGAFEAGTIGGLADWFAVSALFREIPIPIIGRHTNLLVRNRMKFTRGIVEMVQNKWLTPDALRERLEQLSASGLLVEHLGERATRERTVAVVRSLLSRVADDLDGDAVVGLVDRLLKDQLAAIDMARPLGSWLVASVGRRDHDALWDLLLTSAERGVRDGSIARLVENKLQHAVESYANEGFVNKLKVRAAAFLGLEYRVVAEKAVDELAKFLGEAKGAPGHPVRVRLDGMLLGFASDLAAGRGEATRIVEDLRRRLVESADARELIRTVMARFKDTLKRQLATDDSDLSRVLDNILRGIVRNLEDSPGIRDRLDDWVRKVISDLVERHHGVIGEMVEASISKLSDADLVREVEEKVGDDLQMIRVNGAVIGGLVGAALAAGRMILGAP